MVNKRDKAWLFNALPREKPRKFGFLDGYNKLDQEEFGLLHQLLLFNQIQPGRKGLLGPGSAPGAP